MAVNHGLGLESDFYPVQEIEYWKLRPECMYVRCQQVSRMGCGLADCSGEEAGLRNRHQGYSRCVCKHLVTVIAMKNIITYTLTLAEVTLFRIIVKSRHRKASWTGFSLKAQ